MRDYSKNIFNKDINYRDIKAFLCFTSSNKCQKLKDLDRGDVLHIIKGSMAINYLKTPLIRLNNYVWTENEYVSVGLKDQDLKS